MHCYAHPHLHTISIKFLNTLSRNCTSPSSSNNWLFFYFQDKQSSAPDNTSSLSNPIYNISLYLGSNSHSLPMNSGQTDAKGCQLMESSISQTDHQYCCQPDEEIVFLNDSNNNAARPHAMTALSLPAISVMAISALNLASPKTADECYRWETEIPSSEGTSADTELTNAWSSISQNSALLSTKLSSATEQALLYESQILIAENKTVRERMTNCELMEELAELKEQISTVNMDLLLAGIQIMTAKSAADYYETAYM